MCSVFLGFALESSITSITPLPPSLLQLHSWIQPGICVLVLYGYECIQTDRPSPPPLRLNNCASLLLLI